MFHSLSVKNIMKKNLRKYQKLYAKKLIKNYRKTKM